MSRVQTRSRPSRKQAPPASTMHDRIAVEIESGFRQAAADAIHEAHSRAVPVPVADGAGRVTWLHPDGIVRPTREPIHTATPS